MEKLTSILAVLEGPEDGEIVLSKAVELARCFGARVEVLIGEAAHDRNVTTLIRSLGHDAVTFINFHRGDEPIGEYIQQRLARSNMDLVIKTPAGVHPWRRFSFDANDRRLVNECPTPVLLTRNRAWSKPLEFAAAVDVADHDSTLLARGILHAAGFLAMGCEGNLDILYSEREPEESALRMERTVKLAQLVREFHVGCERIQVHSGAPEKTLPPLVTRRQYDVLVLGAQTHMTSQMVEATEGDVLLVKAPVHAESRAKDWSMSGREQRAHEVEQFV